MKAKVLKGRNQYKLASLRGEGIDMRTKSVSLDRGNRKFSRRIKHKANLLD